MARKLCNAIRDYVGRKSAGGGWFRRPNPSARERVERWLWWCERKGMDVPTLAQIEAANGMGKTPEQMLAESLTADR